MSITDPYAQPGRQSSSFGSRLVNLFKQPARLLDRRIHKRLPAPPLRAYLGMVGTSTPFPVANISATGFYMLTEENWRPGTFLPLRLERTDRLGFAALSRMAVQTCVARKDAKGIGFTFLPVNQAEAQRELTDNPQGAWTGTRWADQNSIDDLIAELNAAPSGSQQTN
ncbi:MAG TPA: hypothetical protein VMV57_14265 [Terracidiphilus sp.]|nr:hypothetical protein [Terracidiphilus sp.]